MKYIGKKIITMLITVLLVSLLIFLTFSIIPGDPAIAKLGTEATPERLEALREEMGLNEPLMTRYGKWIMGIFRGDWGDSYSYSQKVTAMIGDKIPVTLTLTVMAFLLILLAAIPLGIYSAKHQGKRMDRCITVVNQVIMAVPPFFSGILITFIFGIILKWFTPSGYVSYSKSPAAFLAYMIFPAIAIALPKIAMTVKLLRNSLLEEFKKDYVRTAYSKGNRTNGVLYGHMLKNALIPVVTFLGMVLADMVAGSIIIEQVFAVPGLGRVLLTSIAQRDYPVVQAIALYIVFFVIAVNFLVDVIYRLIDPRMKVNN